MMRILRPPYELIVSTKYRLQQLTNKLVDMHNTYEDKILMEDDSLQRIINSMSASEKLVRIRRMNTYITILRMLESNRIDKAELSLEDFLRQYDHEFMKHYGVFL